MTKEEHIFLNAIKISSDVRALLKKPQKQIKQSVCPLSLSSCLLLFSSLRHASINILKAYITRIKISVWEAAKGWFTARFPLCLLVLWLGSRAMDTGIHFWQGLSMTTGILATFHAFSLCLTSVNCKATC